MVCKQDGQAESPASRFERIRTQHWDQVASSRKGRLGWSRAYHQRLQEIVCNVVMPGQRVLELGCGCGDLLAAVQPSEGVGIDFSQEMLALARDRYPHLRFIHTDVHRLKLDETFDVVILSDLVNDLWDVQQIFEVLQPLTTPNTRIVLNSYSRVWQPMLDMVKKLGLAHRVLEQNWLTVDDIRGLMDLTGFEIVRHWTEILWPLRTPLLGPFLNKFVAKMWPFTNLNMTNMIVARPQPKSDNQHGHLTVSVIVPARNEAGNMEHVFTRLPEMGGGTEIVFVEGGSSDRTFETIEELIPKYPHRKAKLFRQTGKGKGDAVRLGFREATGDILMILDADLTVPPEDLPRFYEAIRTGKGEMINGVRLVYPMEAQAMRFFNLLGNRFFSAALTWVLGQPIKDSLCGTKVMRKKDYERIAANRAYFGEFDPFGDFDLLFGAARLNMKIVDLPIRYRERLYGETNISRWRHGMVLLRMTLFAARRLKWI